ncbi:chromodomain-helicase-DNA-binding protein 1-like [Liolophura sinensis]|uniref:chromodomain-helicase-DNA-binding protein 1-like n=1 Tax=Liolophura sinensis TaxID=3198878 RepID=UPI0031582D34
MDRIKEKLEILDGKNVKTHVKQEALDKLGLTDIQLRQYQIDGVNWLIERFHREHGCILGDEMGLGKTCQSISFIVYLHGNNLAKAPCLILAPLSVTGNWQTELQKFAPGLEVMTYMGNKDFRENLRHKITRGKKKGKIPFDVLLTTYEILLKDESFLGHLSWSLLVVDEAHRLKNHESILHQALCQFDIEHRVLLTGTPVQNNLKELYSLLSFVAAKIFREKYRETFLEMFENVEEEGGQKWRITELHGILQPFLLRRVKNEVVKDLPQKSEIVLYHNLSSLQKKYYKAILTKDLEAFENPNPGQSKMRLMNVLMQLRKCVNHPYLFDGVEPEPFQLGEHLVTASGKLLLIDNLLRFLKQNGHKVLLFSQMTRMLDIIQDYLGYRGYNYERLDGSVRGEERFLAIQNFNNQEDNFVFLLSTKAGGQGLNLTSADTVIFVDSDFNPQNDLQAAARAHRIGQTRPVRMIRLIGRSTVEEIILRRAEAKLKLTNSVIEGGQFSLGDTKESIIADDSFQLQDILKYGLDKLFEEGENSEEDVNFHKILGGSVNGEWQLEEVEEDATIDDDKGTEGGPQSMYIFEGTDYSKGPSTEDKSMFDKIMEAEKTALEARTNTGGERSRRRTSTTLLAGLPDTSKRLRVKLTPELLEERRRKRKEAAERKALEEEEEEIRRAQRRRQRKEELWRENGYESYNIISREEEPVNEESEEESDSEDESGRRIEYVSGDVTHPTRTQGRNAIIIHCADDSGKWGAGGVFTAIDARSAIPKAHYELAGDMKDLALGDAHLISLDDVQKRENGQDFLGLLIVQHRDRHSQLSGIKLTALSKALEKISRVAKRKNASVHLPRIGYNTPGFNWYGTERLIGKHLVSKHIPTFIYYYPRKRKGTSISPGISLKARKLSRDNKPEMSSSEPSSSSPKPVRLTDVFSGISVYIHGLPEDQTRKIKRYIVAYDGDVDSSLKDTTSHIVTCATTDQQSETLRTLLGDDSSASVVEVDWVEDSVKKGQKLEEAQYRISL